ncbi:hypothetical protein EAS64_01135 [Trebonia kvetii]|uniref:Uncharacterized protein n=1 Tax=Trebonia kvetii TaxID=2480626 RepID=A0A6P2C7S8_9ACTN|nr:hypothetical protein [Trebonia kvetii]TVZ06091.1 hypothetical protein EAS64_01135 [Trebonia kvetii]
MISILVAGAAVVTATAAPPTFGISVSPAVVTGPPSSVTTYTVNDAGKSPLTVRVQAVEERPVKGGGWTPYGEFDQATVSPERFTLEPGRSKAFKVTVRATDGYAHHIAVAAEVEGQAVKRGAAVLPTVAGIY